jgi:hypothetical protein
VRTETVSEYVDLRDPDVALSPRLLSNRVDLTTYPLGVVPVQSRDLIFDDPDTPENEALSDALGRGVLSATVRAGSEQVTVMVAHLKSKLISYARQPGVVSGSTFAPNDEGERLRYAGRLRALPADRRSNDRPSGPRRRVCRGWRQTRRGRGHRARQPGDLLWRPERRTPGCDDEIIQGPGGSEIDFRPGSGFRTGDTATAAGCGTFTGSCRPKVPTTAASTGGRGELIDHVFASHRLVNPDNIPAVEIVAASPLPSMTDDPTPQTLAPSDHAALVATFSL